MDSHPLPWTVQADAGKGGKQNIKPPADMTFRIEGEQPAFNVLYVRTPDVPVLRVRWQSRHLLCATTVEPGCPPPLPPSSPPLPPPDSPSGRA